MKFANLNSKLQRIDRQEGKKRAKNRRKFWWRLIIILLILVVAIYLPVRGAYSAIKGLNRSAKAVSTSFKNDDLDGMRSGLKDIRSEAGQLDSSLTYLYWMRIIPFVGDYYADAKHFSAAATHEAAAAQTLVDALDPYKGELGFNGHPIPGQDRITQFVKIIDKTIPNLDKVQPDLKAAADDVDSINVDKYPEQFGKINVRQKVDTAKNFISGAYYAVSQARDAIKIAPKALGQPDAKNYLIIFQNDKELRATGGFMTAYAYMTLDKGRISSSTSDDIYHLDEKLLEACKSVICPLTPPAPIVKYLPEANGKPRTAWSMRDSNLSPDLPTSMKQFEKMYSFIGSKDTFDGIIMIDTHVVEELIKITGPIDIYGTTYSANLDKRCNCPNVIYELENYSQIIERGEADRKAILGTLMQQILARSLGASTDKLPDFIDVGVKLANSKHIMFYMHDTDTQLALSKLNWTGEIKDYAGDYLHINDSNFAGGKSNLYVVEDVTVDIKPSSQGDTHTVKIVYDNPQPYNIWLNGINRDFVRLYVPKGATLISAKGSEQVVGSSDELGKTVFDGFVQTRPQNSLTLTVQYQVPSQAIGKTYPLLIQKQPGTRDFHYTIKINGVPKTSFALSADKELKLNY